MTPAPASASSLPAPRAPLRRAASDVANRVAAPVFAAAWTAPTRRTSSLAGSASAHSVAPVTAVGSANVRPRAISRSAASRDRSPPSQSSSTALVQVPIGRSVSTGCSACPSQVPLSASLTGPAGTASRTVFPTARAGASSGSKAVMASAASWAAVAVMPAEYPSAPMSDLVLSEDHGAIRHVVLNRPYKRNAFHGELVLATGEALRAAADDPAVRCVVLRGAGPMFSSGMDLGALSVLAEAPEHVRAFRRRCIEAWNLAEEMSKPVICAIQGACIGGALELALACDFRVLAADAIVGMPETRIGLIPDVGGSSRLPQVVGLGRAKELVMTGKLIGAQEAERIGLATRVAAAEELGAAVDQLVSELLACAPVAVG